MTTLATALALFLLLCFPAAASEQKTVELEINGKVALGDLVVPEGGSLSNGALLLTHGTLAHKDMELIEALQNALAERGVATLAHSLTLGQDRREGMYDCTKPHTHAHDDAIAEIAAWLQWLRDNGASTVSALGHSRGGNQVAWYAAEKGGIDKVVLMAPASGRSLDEDLAAYENRFETDLAPALEKSTKLVASGEGATMIDLPGLLYCPDTKASARSIVSYYGAEPRRDTSMHMAKIKIPTLVIAGSKDTVVPDVVQKFEPLADGEQVQLKVVQDADHMFLDFFADDAAELIAGFIKK